MKGNNNANLADRTRSTVKEYYGKVLKTNKDLQTSACCTLEAMPEHLQPLLRQIHPEVQETFYGCGSPVPADLAGCTVLDLGCGSGRDAYLLSQLVGATGRVVGVDMTDEQLDIARRHEDLHASRFGFERSNVEFHCGYIEDLAALGIADASMDVVVSNCVINLSPDKEAVFREILRVLKPGGELCFSDVFVDRRIPADLAGDPLLLGECLGGAMYAEDFRRLLARLGCYDARTISTRPLDLESPEIRQKAGMLNFSSVGVRAYKLDLEDCCEDYGQVASYLGSIPEATHAFDLDLHHNFPAGKPVLVCGNTADILSRTRYARHFRVSGNKGTHFGLFDCRADAPEKSDAAKCC